MNDTTTTTRATDTRAHDNAQAELSNIHSLLVAHETALEAYTKDDANSPALDAAMQAIEEVPLSVGIIKQYEILLSTGGPACRIIGELDNDNQPLTVALQYQDWGTPWTDYPLSPTQSDELISFAGHFYFGD